MLCVCLSARAHVCVSQCIHPPVLLVGEQESAPDMVEAYIEACQHENIRPIQKVLEQLEVSVTPPLCGQCGMSGQHADC